MTSRYRGWFRGVYPYGLACGLVMMAGGFLAQNVDLPIPAVVAVLCAPGFVLAGWSVARRYGADAAVPAGIAAAVTGFAMVAVEYIVGSAIIVGAGMSGRYAILGLIYLPLVALWGALCGMLGQALARFPVRTGPTYWSRRAGR